MKILVLAGGLSPEREVSLSTGTMVCNALREKGQDAMLVDLFYGVEELPGDIESFFADKTPLPPYVIESAVPELSRLREESLSRPYGTIGKNVIELCKAADIVFMALHGENGEDGSVQGLLQIAGIPYVGPHVAASAACMDKTLTKLIADYSGVRQAAWHLVTRQGFARDAESVMNEVEKKFAYPVFVKPAGTGSSVGVSKAKNRGELSAALAQALKAR